MIELNYSVVKQCDECDEKFPGRFWNLNINILYVLNDRKAQILRLCV